MFKWEIGPTDSDLLLDTDPDIEALKGNYRKKLFAPLLLIILLYNTFSMKSIHEDKSGEVGFIENVLPFHENKLSSPNQYSNAKMTDKSLDLLLQDCKTAFTAKNTTGAYSSGSTFFIRASETPRCHLEHLALEIFRFHAERLGIPFEENNSGAEWWTVHIDTRDDIGFHWDRDYGSEESGMLIYPSLATVTYLSQSGLGGATIVLPCAGAQSKDSQSVQSSSRKKSSATVKTVSDTTTDDHALGMKTHLSYLIYSRPHFGKHLYFDGRMLHGAPSDLKGTDEEEEEDDDEDDEEEEDAPMRTTFLVNIWLNHIPISSIRFPKRLLKSMVSSSDHRSKVISAFLQFPKVEMLKPTEPMVFNASSPAAQLNTAASKRKQISAKNNTDFHKILRHWKFCDLLRKYKMTLPLSDELIEQLQPQSQPVDSVVNCHFAKITFDVDAGVGASVEDIGAAEEEEEDSEEEEEEDSEEEEEEDSEEEEEEESEGEENNKEEEEEEGLSYKKARLENAEIVWNLCNPCGKQSVPAKSVLNKKGRV